MVNFMSGNSRIKLSFIILGIGMVCILDCLLIMFNASEKYWGIFLLPISFAVCSFFFNRVYQVIKHSLSSLILISMMFLKNVIVPLFMALGDGNFPARVDTSKYMLSAIGLEIYEEIAVFGVIWLLSKKITCSAGNFQCRKLEFNINYLKMFNIITLIFSLSTVVLIFRYPLLIEYFSLGISGNEQQNIQKNIIQNQMIKSVPSMAYYLFTILANFVRWAIPLCIMFKCYISKKGNDFSKTLVSLIVILLAAYVTNDTIAVSFFIVISMGYVLIKLFPVRKRILIICGVIAIGIVGTLSLITKAYGSAGGGIDFQKIANMLQAYFSGPDNVAVALSIKESFSLDEFIGNIFRFIPYIMHYFLDYTTSTVIFNNQYWGNSGLTNQIIPMISQGERTFSFILAPIFTIIISAIAINVEISALKKNDLFDYAIYIIWGICFAMAVGMYSASLCIQLFLNYIFMLMVIKWISKKFKI